MKCSFKFKNLISVSVLTLISSAAIAGGPDMPPPPSMNGLFLGPQFGLALAQVSTNHSSTARSIPQPDTDNLEGFPGAGLDIGYGHSWGHFYIGGDFNWLHLAGFYTTNVTASTNVSYTHKASLTNHLGLNLELGYLLRPTMLLYVTTGYARLQVKESLNNTFGANTETQVSLEKWVDAPSFGLGMKFLLTPHFILGAYTAYEEYSSVSKTVSPNTIKIKVKGYEQIAVQLNYLINM
jgi:opacity protein-like surface antigen